MKKILLVLCFLGILNAGYFDNEEDKVKGIAKTFLQRVNIGDYSVLEHKNMSATNWMIVNKSYHRCMKKSTKQSKFMKYFMEEKEKELKVLSKKISKYKKEIVKELENKYPNKYDVESQLLFYKQLTKIYQGLNNKDINKVMNNVLKTLKKYQEELKVKKLNVSGLPRNYMHGLMYEAMSKEFINESSQCISEATGYKPMMNITNVSIAKDIAYVSYTTNMSKVATIQLNKVNTEWHVK